MENKHKVSIYSTPTCPYCNMAKEYFKNTGVEFKDFNVALDEAAANEMIKKSGQMGVPVIDIDGRIVLGFRQEVIEELLK